MDTEYARLAAEPVHETAGIWYGFQMTTSERFSAFSEDQSRLAQSLSLQRLVCLVELDADEVAAKLL